MPSVRGSATASCPTSAASWTRQSSCGREETAPCRPPCRDAGEWVQVANRWNPLPDVASASSTSARSGTRLHLTDIAESAVALERLLLLDLADGSDLAIEVDQPRLLRVQLAAARAARTGSVPDENRGARLLQGPAGGPGGRARRSSPRRSASWPGALHPDTRPDRRARDPHGRAQPCLRRASRPGQTARPTTSSVSKRLSPMGPGPEPEPAPVARRSTSRRAYGSVDGTPDGDSMISGLGRMSASNGDGGSTSRAGCQETPGSTSAVTRDGRCATSSVRMRHTSAGSPATPQGFDSAVRLRSS